MASLPKRATEKLLAALNRADEIGGEIRDYVQDKVVTESRDERTQAADARAKQAAAAAAPTPVKVDKGLGDPGIKAQIYGKKSCPWTGRAITLLERHKVDFDYIDLEEPEHEPKLTSLALETKQNTVPYVYLRGQFIGGFNALSEV